MGFGQAITAAFTNYFNFSSRSTRPEYWYFILFIFIASIVTAIIDFVVFDARDIGPLNGIFTLATLIPSLSVSVRRLHDIGRTGWWVLIGIIPIIGWIVLIVFACQQGNRLPTPLGRRLRLPQPLRRAASPTLPRLRSIRKSSCRALAGFDHAAGACRARQREGQSPSRLDAL